MPIITETGTAAKVFRHLKGTETKSSIFQLHVYPFVGDCHLALFSPSDRRIVEYKKAKAQNWEEISSILKDWGSDFSAIRFLTFSSQSECIPSQFYEGLSNHNDSPDQALSNEIKGLAITNTFPSHPMIQELRKELGSVVEIDYQSILLEHFTAQEPSDKPTVYLSLHPGHCSLLVGHENKILFQNHFEFAGETEVLYFLMAAIEETGFDLEMIQILLSGDLNQTLETLLSDYIPNILKLGSDLPFAEGLDFTDAERLELFAFLRLGE